jgi:hypothetical protein
MLTVESAWDDLEGSLSFAAIEAALKLKVLETLDTVAFTYKRLRRLQELDIQFHLKSTSLSSAQKRKYKKLKKEIIAEPGSSLAPGLRRWLLAAGERTLPGLKDFARILNIPGDRCTAPAVFTA